MRLVVLLLFLSNFLLDKLGFADFPGSQTSPNFRTPPSLHNYPSWPLLRFRSCLRAELTVADNLPQAHQAAKADSVNFWCSFFFRPPSHRNESALVATGGWPDSARMLALIHPACKTPSLSAGNGLPLVARRYPAICCTLPHQTFSKFRSISPPLAASIFHSNRPFSVQRLPGLAALIRID